MYRKIITLLSGIIGLSFGITVGPAIWMSMDVSNQFLGNPLINAVIFGFIFILLGLLIAPIIERTISRLIDWINRQRPLSLVIHIIGTLIGLVIGYLVSLPFTALNIPFLSTTLPVVSSIVLALVGYQTVRSREEEIIDSFENWQLLRQSEKNKAEDVQPIKEEVELPQEPVNTPHENFQPYKLLDTSVIIDGRIVDIVRTNFIEGTLLIPNFVLHELQLIADSSDNLKRAKGRRGLDILNELQSDANVSLESYEGDFDDLADVDSKLVRLAKMIDAVVVTNDYNLNKVCEFQNITVFNINELANALKPILIPGEELSVFIIKAGTERKQGVAYLDDGTMIVVEDGQNYMNEEISVIVTSALQTAAGRMIFAKPI